MAFDINKNSKIGKNLSSATKNNDKLKAKENFKIEFIDINKLVENKKNLYELVNIDELAEDIKLNGLHNNLLARPLDNGTYELIGGHRRYNALKKLVNEGNKEFILVPVQVKKYNDVDMEINLIMDNALTRELTDTEKLNQVKRLKELAEEKKKLGEDVGSVRKFIAKSLNLSETQVQRYSNVDKNLIEELKQMLNEGKMKFSSANELASLNEESQKALVNIVRENEITKSQAEQLKQKVKKLENDKVDEIKDKSNELKEQHEKLIQEVENNYKKQLEEKEKNYQRLLEENRGKINTIKELSEKELELEKLKKNIDKNIQIKKEELEKEMLQKEAEIKSKAELQFEKKIAEMEKQLEKERADKEELNRKLKELDEAKEETDESSITKEELKKNSEVKTKLESLLIALNHIKEDMNFMKKNNIRITYDNLQYLERVVSVSKELDKLRIKAENEGYI